MKCFTKFLAAAAFLALFATSAVAQVPGVPGPNFKNLLDNGRMDIYQRGTTAVTAVTTPVYHADRWAGTSSSASASVSLTNITANLPTGFVNAEKFQRASANTITVPVCLIQEIPTSDITALQGQPVVLSAWVLAGGNLSSAGSTVNFELSTGTGTDQGLTLLTNGNNWTGQATVTFSQAITTTWQRYSWTTTLPATATEAAVQFCFTPVGTAGTDDSVTVTGVQLEQGTFSTNFEDRPLGIETAKVQRYFYQLNEGTASAVFAWCQVPSTNNETCMIPLPVPLRTTSVASTAITITTGLFKMNSAASFATWSSPTASTSANNMLTITAVNTATAGQITTIYNGTCIAALGCVAPGKVAVSEDF